MKLLRMDRLEDIYNRQFTGDADVDPIGGRKRPGLRRATGRCDHHRTPRVVTS